MNTGADLVTRDHGAGVPAAGAAGGDAEDGDVPGAAGDQAGAAAAHHHQHVRVRDLGAAGQSHPVQAGQRSQCL